MSDNDVVRAEDLAVVRASISQTGRRVITAAVVTPLAAGFTVGLLVYYLKSYNFAASAFIAALSVLLGVPVLIHWWRHYRRIFGQLDLLEQRLRNGEIIYGSQVAFHSHW